MNNKKIRGWEGLTDYSKQMYQTKYFLEGESYEGWVNRVCNAYADNASHANRLRGYLTKYWWHPSTPVSSNAGVPDRGLPISCYTNEVPDTKKGIFEIFSENNWLGSLGGGIGTYWGNVRSLGEKVGEVGVSGGTIPFVKVSDTSTLAISQGGRRRASQAVYLPVSHPEILEFIDIRRPTGDAERRCPNIHHGIVLSDAFLYAVLDRASWDLVSPKTGEVLYTVDAFDLFKKILITRVETGEPYLIFGDTVNRTRPEEYKSHELFVKLSNLCTEIMLSTDEDHTGVCCLVSLNLEYYDEFKGNYQFYEDIHRFTDNVLQSFIDLTENMEGFEKARRSAIRERSIGVGVMGYTGMLQKMHLPYNSLAARYHTDAVFTEIADMFHKSNRVLAIEKGTAPISDTKRNVHVTAIAPTASISILCDLASPGIDPRFKNIYVEKTDIGSHTIKNKYLARFLLEKAEGDMEWYDEQWEIIKKSGGSVKDLEWMDEEDKEVFLTAHEINQFAIIEAVSIMTPDIDQGISCNVFLPPDVNAQTLYDLHITAWKKGVKSLYYVRSGALSRANIGGTERADLSMEKDTCLGCA